MIYFLCFNLIIIIPFCVGVFFKDCKVVKFMEREFTTTLKGFSILTVIWAHGGAYLGIPGLQFVAGVGVSLFIICSGYGLEVSYEKNGINFFWVKRIYRLGIPIILSIIIYNLLGGNLSINSIGNELKRFFESQWFIVYIIICYILFYISKLISNLFIKSDSRDRMEIVILFLMFGIFFCIECFFPNIIEIPFLRTRQMISFPFGVFFAKYKDKIEEIFNNKVNKIIIILGAIGLTFVGITQIYEIKIKYYVIGNYLSIFTVFPLAIVCLLLFNKYIFLKKNSFFRLTGLISYELYISQGYILTKISQNLKNLIVIAISTFLFATVIHLLSNLLDKSIIFFKHGKTKAM